MMLEPLENLRFRRSEVGFDKHADVAQLVAHPTCNRAVRGSSPLVGPDQQRESVVATGFSAPAPGERRQFAWRIMRGSVEPGGSVKCGSC